MIRGLLFDINGTVTDILTNEEHSEIYRVLSNFLDYQGVPIPPSEIKRMYSDINKRQRRDSENDFPEFDIVALFAEILDCYATEYTHKLPKYKLKVLPEVCAEIFRSASRFKLELYPDVKKTLDILHEKYRMAAVSDGQKVWAIPELYSVGLLNYFDPIIVSSDNGFRKPDARMFHQALDKMRMTVDEVIFVGNDLYRDIYGANLLGMKSVFFKSNQGDHDFEKSEADYIIYDFAQLPEAIRFLERKS